MKTPKRVPPESGCRLNPVSVLDILGLSNLQVLSDLPRFRLVRPAPSQPLGERQHAISMCQPPIQVSGKFRFDTGYKHVEGRGSTLTLQFAPNHSRQLHDYSSKGGALTDEFSRSCKSTGGCVRQLASSFMQAMGAQSSKALRCSGLCREAQALLEPWCRPKRRRQRSGQGSAWLWLYVVGFRPETAPRICAVFQPGVHFRRAEPVAPRLQQFQAVSLSSRRSSFHLS